MATTTTTNQRAAEHLARFIAWFQRSGHWVYEYRADAARTWRERGIDGRPDYLQACEPALQAWVDADPLPAILAKAAA